MGLSLVSDRGFTKMTSQEDDPDPDFIKIHKKILEETISKANAQPFFLYLHYPKIHHSIKKMYSINMMIFPMNTLKIKITILDIMTHI